MFKVARIIITSFLCNNYMPIQCACQIYSAIVENGDIPFLMRERIYFFWQNLAETVAADHRK